MPVLRIRLLGDFQLTYDDQLLTTINTARLQALLAYLVLHRHAPQSRQHLAFLFWPDTNEAQALTNLRNLLHKLRHALPDPDRFLRVDTQTVQWRPDALFTADIIDFEATVAHAQTRAELEVAVKLYRGVLLPSCYDDWILAEREGMQRRAMATLTRLIDLLETAHAYRAAIGYGQQLRQLNPTDETLYAKLMRLHAADGDRAGLLRTYQSCVTTLQAEFAVEPAPATDELYQRLLLTLAIPSSPSPSPAAVHTNLPIATSSFVGRQREMTAVKALLAGNAHDDDRSTSEEDGKPVVHQRPPAGRLVTLTGAGGSGKTRLALQVATDLVERYKDGVWWVELVALMDGALVPQAVAQLFDVRDAPSETLRATLAHFLQDKQLLLVLDNCEHLVDACAQLAYTLISRCPKVQILATSREPLGITGEQCWQAPTLSLPDPHLALQVEHLLQAEAICLFVERAQTHDATFRLTAANAAAVLQICTRLDGIPLAIELAAARRRVLSVEQIAARLNDCLNLLTAGSRTAPPRHQTLRATLDWSYDLLTDEERLLLRRLGVFAGSFSLEAVETVCGPLPTPVLDVFAHLVEKSLVTIDRTSGGVHYRLLETIHEYAREKLLLAAEEAHLRANHLRFFIQFAEAAYPQLHGTEQERWLAWIERAHDNVRAALHWALGQGKRIEALRLAGAMGLFWEIRGYWSEGRQWLAQALAVSEETGSNQSSTSPMLGWAALALLRAGSMKWRQCDFTSARTLLEESLTLYQTAADQENIATVRGLLGGVAFEQGDYIVAQSHYAEYQAVARGSGDKHQLGMGLFGLGLVAYHLGDYATAQTHLTESLTLLRESGHKSDTPYALNALGNLANLQGDYATAATFYTECLALRRAVGDKRGVAATLNDIANLTAKQGDYTTARVHYTESIRLFRELGNQRSLVWALSGLARLGQARGQLYLAAKLLSAVDALLRAMNARLDEPEHSDSALAIATLRTQLDTATFNSAGAEGQRLTLEQALTLAQQSA